MALKFIVTIRLLLHFNKSGISLVDPTGCGDAYRAGLLYGISNKFSWEDTGKLASVMGSIKITTQGGQNHNSFTFKNRRVVW